MLKQELRIKQKQKLLPIQYQAIRMLEYSTFEIEEMINKELEANPALEETVEEKSSLDASDHTHEDDEYGNNDMLTDDLDIMEQDNSYDDDNYYIKNQFSSGIYDNVMPVISSEESFRENLILQIDETDADIKTKELAKYIIGNIDESGYLMRDIQELLDDLAFSMNIQVSSSQLDKALELVHSLEPAGIGARNLNECLLIQILRKEPTESIQIATTILSKYFEQFTSKKYSIIKSKLKIGDDLLKEAISEILKLNPKPGNEISVSKSDILSSHIVPDFIVEQYNGNIYVSLNNYNFPKLNISQSYLDLLNNLSKDKNKSKDTRDALAFTKKKIESANIFIEAIKQRNLTLIRTMIAITKKQKEFFLSGDVTKLVPMKLQDISDMINYDPSTISRVTNSKYVQTQYGVYLLKYFFSESIKTDSGKEVSNKKVKYIMEDIIKKEDPNNPLTDMEIAKELNSQGYKISRRTIAKYRDQLNIPTTNKRGNKTIL